MSSRKVRVKKLSVKTALPVLREDQIDPSEYDALTTETQIATGVEQAEENEYHLQSILKDAGTSNDQEIPVPPPQESDISYDGLYPSNWQMPFSYIRSSQTVEESISCQYDMTLEDDQYLKSHNGSSTVAGGPLSEDDFERIMEVFEDTAAEQTPFASVDNTVVGYDMMVPTLNQLQSPIILQHAKAVYEYWKTRRQDSGNKPLRAMLKFETHQDSDDTDPYVCFRRREARQTRKTRGRDNKVAETLKKLRREMEDGRQLVLLSYEREMMKRDLLHMDRAIFQERAQLKRLKQRLGIKTDEEDLVNQKPQKRKPVEPPAVQRPAGPQQRGYPSRPVEGRSVEADLVTYEEKMAERENLLRIDVENKVANHRRWNQHHIDLTKDPLSPVKEAGSELKFRPAKTQYLMTPPASEESDSMDVDEEQEAPQPMELDTPALPVFQFKAGGAFGEPRQMPAFRRRWGRLNRLWIDRRGVAASRVESEDNSDRWKYDSDDEEDPPVYEVDPFDIRALNFRSEMSPYMAKGRPALGSEAAASGQPPNRALQAAPAGSGQITQGQGHPQPPSLQQRRPSQQQSPTAAPTVPAVARQQAQLQRPQPPQIPKPMQQQQPPPAPQPPTQVPA